MNLASRIELWPVERLRPYERNARTHSPEQIAKIAASMAEFGFTQPILVASGDSIVAGHGRLEAAKRLGLPEVPVIVLDHLTDAQRRAYILADNRLALDAGWDDELLAEELAALEAEGFDLALTGFSDDELADLLAPIDCGPEPQTDPDAVPPVPVAAVSRLGDVWLLGAHRVMCGSSTSAGDLTTLMQGNQADMVFTDPPYLMNYQGAIDGDGNSSGRHRPILNDNLGRSEGDAFLREIASAVAEHCQGAWYICFHRLGIDRMMAALGAAGLRWRNLIVWKKNHLNLSNSDYKSIYEPIIFGWRSDYEPVLYGWSHDHVFYGPKGAVDVVEVAVPSVWEIARTAVNDLHPTMKPVALCEAAILNSSRERQVVLDLFGGSGSTLIAAEKNRRAARVMELEPTYVDVIVRRWQDYTGKAATLESNGRTFETLSAQRMTAANDDTFAAKRTA